MAQSKSLQLINKSVECMVSAIELYNKPDFKYREEVFCILAINSWELLLKAKILKDSANNLNSIYIREYLNTKSGTKSKKWKYKKNRSKNKYTIEIFGALKKLKSKGLIDEICHANIETLIEIRDNAVHFYNKDPLLARKIQEVGTANIRSYLMLVQDWFSKSLEQYNFYLMPMAFFRTSRIEPVFLGSRDNAINNLLAYIAKNERKYPSNPQSRHNITIAIETRMVKSNSDDVAKIKITSDRDAPEYRITIEDIQKTHPLDYGELTEKLRRRYENFKINQEYHEVRKILESDPQYCFLYPLNPKNSDSATKSFFSFLILSEFDKHYVKKRKQ